LMASRMGRWQSLDPWPNQLRAQRPIAQRLPEARRAGTF